MSDLDNLINSSANSAPMIGQTMTVQHMSQQSPEGGSVSAVTAVNTSAGAVNDVLTYNDLNCETMAYNTNTNQLLSSLIAENNYKSDESLNMNDRQPIELTFSDLTPPVPNVSTLESNRLLSVDTSLPTVDGVSGAVPEPKSCFNQQMSSMPTDAPSIEIPSNETMVPSMAPKEAQTLLTAVADNQYSNIFQPVMNGPSGSAPQTPAASPIAAMDSSGQSVPSVMPTESGVDTQQMQTLNTFESSSASFANSNVGSDVYNVPISQMDPTNNEPTVNTEGMGPLPVLGVEPSIQEQLLDAIPPPSVNFPPGPVPEDERGIPSALPGEFPLSLPAVEEEKVGGIESASVPLDKIEATINMNAKPIPTLTDAISVTQSEVNLIKSLPHSPQQSTGPQFNVLSAQQEFTLNYTSPLQTSAEQTVVYTTTCLSRQSGPAVDQLTGQTTQTQPTQSAQQTSPTLQQTLPQTHTLQTLTTLQPSQSVLASESVHSQPIVSASLVNVPEVQLPPPPAPPSATSIGVFDTNPNGMMSEIVSQNQMTNVLPPPPPLQPVQSVNSLPEMNTLTNLMPVVEPSEPSLRQPLSVVIKTEPQSYNEKESTDTSISKVNDDNNNPILNSRIKDSVIAANAQTSQLVTELRGFPLCVISTAPTSYVSRNKTTIVAPKYELTLPPKKAKFTTTGLVSVTPQQISSHPLKSVQTSQAVPSTGMLYDLPHQTSDHSPHISPTFRVQSGLSQPLKLPHNMTPPFTTVSPILLSNLMPSVSVIDGPLSLVKEEKVRQLITANHPDYPAISGLLSFISPYHKPLTTSAVTTGQTLSGAEVPLSLSVKNNMSGAPIIANSLSHSHPSSHVPSLTRPSVHLNLNQSITSVSSLVHTPPTAVPVSVVTSVVDHNRGFNQRIKTVGQNSTKNKINVEHNATGTTGVKLQLAPLLSGDPAKPFQCAICGKHLASKNVYQLHLRSHSGEKPFTCNLCGHSFSQKTSLTRHMRSHTGERPFPCQVCGKRFADKERIKIHMRTHTGEKPFACDICGKQFSQKSTVKRHMSVHTGEKPFKCETCGKGFANRGNLTAHTKTHSNS